MLYAFSFYFLWFLTVFSQFLQKSKIKLVLAIPTGAPVIDENDAIELLPVVTDY